MPALITDVMLVECRPDPAADVTATATIGNAQLGAWAMLIDGKFIRGGNQPAAVPLGKGAALAGKVLEVSATITDVQGAHDRLSLRVRVTGLAKPIDLAHDGEPGGRAAYSVLVEFVSGPAAGLGPDRFGA
jgi:hypothetical protein